MSTRVLKEQCSRVCSYDVKWDAGTMFKEWDGHISSPAGLVLLL